MLLSRPINQNKIQGNGDLVDRATLQWLLVAQGIAIFPLFFYLPLWLPLMWVAVVFARIQIFRGAWPFPKGTVKTLLGAVCIIGLVLSYRRVAGVEPMVAFLVVAFVLKLVEVRDKNGVLLVVFIGFIAVAALFIFSQAFWTAIYSLLTLTVLFGCMQSMFRNRVRSKSSQIKQAFYLLLKSLPVMGILFLVLPRIGPLWAVPEAGESGKTGFSDSMSPGDFSRLVRTSDIAFRVNFDPDETGTPEVPPVQERYWRGLVLDTFDGRNWRFIPPWNRMGPTYRPANRPHPQWDLRTVNGSRTYKYSVLLEPHLHPWLFSLTVPMAATSELKMGFTDNYLLMTEKDVRYRMLYRVESRKGLTRGLTLNKSEKELNLIIPPGNAATRALANEWLQKGYAPSQIVEQALALFNREFSYSLEPPTLGQNSVDDFLFSTKIGFCEHFSSSFTYLMRAAGIPARVVVGYQGGSFSEDGSHFVVRQSDAHAWSEVWLADQGWVRVDPTNAVAPERIQLGIQGALDSSEVELLNTGLWGVAWTQAFLLRWEELEYLWQKNVLSYDEDRQSSFLKKLLGGKGSWRLALFLVGGVGLLLLLYQVLPGLTFGARQQSESLRLYRKYLRAMEKQGVEIYEWETAEAFAARVSKKSPEKSKLARRIAALYNAIEFAERKELMPQFRAVINQIS